MSRICLNVASYSFFAELIVLWATWQFSFYDSIRLSCWGCLLSWPLWARLLLGCESSSAASAFKSISCQRLIFQVCNAAPGKPSRVHESLLASRLGHGLHHETHQAHSRSVYPQAPIRRDADHSGQNCRRAPLCDRGDVAYGIRCGGSALQHPTTTCQGRCELGKQAQIPFLRNPDHRSTGMSYCLEVAMACGLNVKP